MVSKFDHCLGDLLYRWQNGELAVDMPLVVSNHDDCQRAGRPPRHPVRAPPGDARTRRPAAEARLLELVDEHGIDLVVLARYMQVLSDDAVRAGWPAG